MDNLHPEKPNLLHIIQYVVAMLDYYLIKAY